MIIWYNVPEPYSHDVVAPTLVPSAFGIRLWGLRPQYLARHPTRKSRGEKQGLIQEFQVKIPCGSRRMLTGGIRFIQYEQWANPQSVG